MTQGWGNYDTVRVEGWGFRRIEEGQQGVWGGAVGVSAPVRGGADGTVGGANGAVMCYNLRTVLTKQVRRVANGKTASSDGESEGAAAEDSV